MIYSNNHSHGLYATGPQRFQRLAPAGRYPLLIRALTLITLLGIAILPPTAAADPCPNTAFRTGPSSRLPDCRAYEMVSPVYTNDGGIQPYATAADGSSLLGLGLTGFAGIEGDTGTPGAFYRLTRTESGWVTTPISLPASQFVSAASSVDSQPRDTGVSLWLARPSTKPAGALDVYMERPDGSILDMGPAMPPGVPPSEPEEEVIHAELKLVDASDDGTHVIFSLESPRWSINGEAGGLYEYVGTGNSTPLLVGVDDSGHLISPCGEEVLGAAGEGLSKPIESKQNALSGNGRTVFFTSYPCSGGGGPPVPELFARIDNGEASAHTVAISEPAKSDCSACDTEPVVQAPAHFEGASVDGSKVYFETTQPLLGSDSSKNLYEYDFDAPAGERVTRISTGDSTVSNPTADVQGRAVQISQDGSHIYFVATGSLTLNENPYGQQARRGADNLYVVEPDPTNPAEKKIAFIVQLCAARDKSGSVPDGRCPPSESGQGSGSYDEPLWSGYERKGADTTPDGRYLVFTSFGDLTPDDTSIARQAFEYDAQAEHLVRISIGQNGFNDNGNTPVADASIVSPPFISGLTQAQSDAYLSALTVSADGSKVFFQSPAGLTPQAVNDHILSEREELIVEEGHPELRRIPNYTENIYEYSSPNGNITEGDVFLISDGQDINSYGEVTGVQLIGTNESGSDVFFTTLDQLVTDDTSQALDIYDARVNGGFPPTPSPLTCSGDACQGPLAAAPTLLSPGSEFQIGSNPPLAGSRSVVKRTVKPKKHRKKARKPKRRSSRTRRRR